MFLGPLLDVLNDNQTHFPSLIIIIIIHMDIQLFILVINIISDNFHYIPITCCCFVIKQLCNTIFFFYLNKHKLQCKKYYHDALYRHGLGKGY